jgi:hypothetical protein
LGVQKYYCSIPYLKRVCEGPISSSSATPCIHRSYHGYI